ncbi:LysM peptidoglycan-binding domain-containing protein [Actinoplanes sp. L3-i22]|uniref:LysM peptidoglycan-binding domain-containing protein n=1 Tax=Actinoplanes sp. L3-i22 TaxID=2836373 RepID=UPI001C74A4BD|nr:LysM peptidoglycan-binding domain-containing protein [Actinoplanes sp. L3-i22]BCY08903.1 hypothetical protein L3i22_039910 [Actinoplanes sp. L3-i22]
MRTGLTLFVILTGLPAGLVALAGSPLPARAPTSADLQAWLANPTATQFLPGLLATLAWLCWALAAAGTVRLAAARSAGRLSRLIQQLPGPLQSLAATVLGAAAVTASYSPAAAAAPPTATAAPTAPATFHTPAVEKAQTDPACTVTKGDTLSRIAKQRLGDPDRWPTIFKLNHGKKFPAVGGRLTDPDLIYPGWQLRLPTGATTTDSGDCTGKPATVTHQPPRHTPDPDASPATPAPTTTTASPSASPGRSHTGSAPTSSIAALTLTAGFAYGAGLLWRRRRRPRPAAEAATATTANPAPETPVPSEPGRPAQFLPPRNPATALIGPGAQDAARAALVAVLTGALEGTTAVTTTATLAGLLDNAPSSDRITVADDFAAALARLDEEIIRRTRLADERDDERAAPAPAMLLLAEVPGPAWHTRLATAARQGEPLGIDVTLLGAWPSGLTLNVAADGSTEAGELAVLDAGTAAGLLEAAKPPADPVHTPPPTPDRVSIRVLGKPAILGADANPVRGLRAKSLELCVLLVLNRDGIALGDIMEALWPEVTVARATERLSTCVTNLRNIIRGGIHRTGARVDPVINTGGRYHLNAELVDVDWWRIVDAHRAATTAGDDQTRLRHLRTAITAAAGRTLGADTAYEWIDTDRERARRLLIRIHLQAAGLLAGTDAQTARGWHETASDYDPMSEELARHAMQAAADLGDADGVRHRREQLHRALADAGIDADTDTDRFAAALLQNLTFTHP